MGPETIAIIILVFTLLFFATEIIPSPITAILSSLMMCICGITTPKEFAEGFSNPVTLFCFGIAVVGSALTETGCARLLGGKILSYFHFKEKGVLIVLIISASIFSMFLSNTSVVVIFMSIAAAMAVSSKGKITKKNTYMAIGIASVAGGGCTLIGSTTQLAVNALLPLYGMQQLSMFTLFGPGLGIIILLPIYYYFWGYKRQLKYFNFKEVEAEYDGESHNIKIVSKKESKFSKLRMYLPLAVLFFCIMLTIIEWKSIAVIGMLGAMAVVVLGSISVKRMWATTDWNTLGVIAGGVGMAAGIRNSGACDIVAVKILVFLGSDAPAIFYFAIFVLLATTMTNIMPNISTALVLTPIVISVANTMGFNPLPFVIGIIWGANMPYSTPIGSSVITMTMQGGYSFKHYVFLGLPYNILAALSVIVLTPFFYALTK
jgi:solute carrier family 13 (sodium-dependent dicarboxylate transporter), member 2/3/5